MLQGNCHFHIQKSALHRNKVITYLYDITDYLGQSSMRHFCYVALLLTCNSYMLSTHVTCFPILNKGLGICIAFLTHEALFPQTLALVEWSLLHF